MSMSDGNKPCDDLQKKFLELYTIACAPLNSKFLLSDTLNTSPQQITPSSVLQECRYLYELSRLGMETFSSIADTLNVESLNDKKNFFNNPEQISTLFITASSFTKRLSLLANHLSVMCNAIAEQTPGEYANSIQLLEEKSKQKHQNDLLSHQVKSYLDVESKDKWSIIESPLKNRVGFKTTTAVISDGKIEEQDLKVAEFRRRRQRNPTGYQKFHFRNINGIEDSETEYEERRGASTDGGSTRGSITFALEKENASTSRSMSSESEDNELEGTNNQFDFLQSGSSVGFSFDKERQIIDDDIADPGWEQKNRHQKRFSRIRNRVPTGHPSMMRDSSNELSEIVNEYQRWMSNSVLDENSVANTEANKQLKETSNEC